MRFSFSDEQEQLRRVVRRFLEDRSPPSEVRRWMATSDGCDLSLWRDLCQELGLGGAHVPTHLGGQGLGFVELGIVLEEMGRVLLCAPYFASVALAATAILNAASEEQKGELLPAIVSGRTTAALAVCEPNGRFDATGIELEATACVGTHRLDGVKSFVVDGHTADLLVVAGRAPRSSGVDGLSFFTVRGDASGLVRRPLTAIDATRKLARLEFSGVQADLLGEAGAAAPALARTSEHAAVGLANEMVGGAQKVLEMAVEYAKSRVQFGRSIGSFQAIKHKCADMLLEVELAKSAAYYAAAASAEEDADLPALASLAKSLAADAYLRAAAENIQIHGGIGFTWEHDAHLYFKRAKSSEVLFGDPPHHREQLAQRLLTSLDREVSR